MVKNYKHPYHGIMKINQVINLVIYQKVIGLINHILDLLQAYQKT